MPNSPPTASVTPVRIALKLESTNTRVANEAMTRLDAAPCDTSSARMIQISRHNALKSSSMPTEMKNRPSRMSRNGRMTLSTWWLYSVSASIIPARNAPSAIDSPARCEAQADDSATSSTASVNSSRRRLLAMTYSSGRSSQRPAASTTSTAAVPAPTSFSAMPNGEGLAARRQRGGQREERHHRDVLEQHDAECEAAVRAVELGALGELLHDEHRGAHGDHTAEHDALRPLEPEQTGDERHHGRGAEHLHGPQPEHLAPQRHHARPGEFEAQREQQEDHAELGQQVRRVGFGEHADGVRAQDEADRDVAQDGRQPEAARQRHDEYRRG